jgi:hypothetical protein
MSASFSLLDSDTGYNRALMHIQTAASLMNDFHLLSPFLGRLSRDVHFQGKNLPCVLYGNSSRRLWTSGSNCVRARGTKRETDLFTWRRRVKALYNIFMLRGRREHHEKLRSKKYQVMFFKSVGSCAPTPPRRYAAQCGASAGGL